MITAFETRPTFRFSLRALFGVTTITAILLCYFVWVSQAVRRSSPDKVEFWLDWFHNGTPQERESAANVIATYVRTGPATQPMIDALCEAAADKNVNIRSAAAFGLDKLARTNQRAQSVLQRLADNDPDENVRSMASQALLKGID